jgi:ribosomal protein L40E
MIKIFSAGNLQDAYLLQSLLIEAGIENKILNEFAQGGTGEIPFTHAYPEIWLTKESDIPGAKEIIASFEQRPNDVGTRVCTKCGEPNPDTFEVCWRCGASLPAPD